MKLIKTLLPVLLAVAILGLFHTSAWLGAGVVGGAFGLLLLGARWPKARYTSRQNFDFTPTEEEPVTPTPMTVTSRHTSATGMGRYD